MAGREMRASWRRLVFFFICIAIGVGSIVALRSVIQSVRVALAGEARSMLGADVRVSSNNELTPDVRQRLLSEEEQGRLGNWIETIELSTMVRPADARRAGARMVELRAVPVGFPLYGTLTLQDGPYSHERLVNRGTLVRPELLAQLGLNVGDAIAIGNTTFTIRGVIAAEPGRRVGAFSVGPRVMIDFADLASTGLLSFGSRVSRQILFTAPPSTDVERLTIQLRAAFANEFVSVRSYRRSEDQMGENFQRAEDYLSLVGFVVLVLGGIGVSSVTRIFVQQKIRSVAILKCVGGTSGQVLAVYLAQVLALGLLGCVWGVALAAGVVAAVPYFVGDVAGLKGVEYGLTVSAVAQGVSVGLLVSLLFALVPLLEVRHVKPSLLLRQETTAPPGFDWVRWTTTALAAGVLVVIAAWQAGSVRIALILCGGFVGTSIVLHAAGLLLIRAVQPLRYTRSFAIRQAVLHLSRPGSQTSVILLAVGLGTFFILGVRALQSNLVEDFSIQMGEDAPDFFMLDVQTDQRDALAAYVDRANGDQPGPTLMPVLRARVISVQGKEINLESFEDVRGRGSLAREYTVTYRDALEHNEEILDGEWWSPEPTSLPEVSIEESLQERFDIRPGDSMAFDVLGRRVVARVANVRRVNWRDFRTGGFMFVFSPQTFAGAPHTYISTATGPADPQARGALVAGVVGRFPNVSVIDLREVLDTVRGVVEQVTLAITVVGGLVLASGVLILVGAVSMTKFQRVYEAAILRTLGATTRLVAAMLFAEYGVLGMIAGTIGALGAVVLSWAIAEYALEMPWSPNPLLSIAGIVLTGAVVAAVGVIASLDVLRHKPLATLRAE